MVATAPLAPLVSTPAPSNVNVEDLLKEHERLLYWFAVRRFYLSQGNRIGYDLEDFVQEIRLNAIKSIHTWNSERCKFSTWLGRKAFRSAQRLRARVEDKQGEVRTVGGTLTSATGEEVDRFATIADPAATDPAAGVALVRVLVPVLELALGAVSLAWVRDVRSGKRVQVPAADVVTFHGRLFAVAVSFDEGDDELHRVRFGNDVVAWVMARVSE